MFKLRVKELPEGTTLWGKIKIKIWLWRCTRIIKKEILRSAQNGS